jgi:YesN/AraC family two-component response regulator
MDVEMHRHAAYQIVLTTDSTFQSIIDGTLHSNIFGFIIKPQVSHLCTGVNGTCNIINIEPDSELGMILSHKLINEQVFVLNHSDDLKQFFEIHKTPDTNNITKLLQQVLSKSNLQHSIDARIVDAIEFIKKHQAESLSTEILADKVFLSPSRFSALFKKETGSSFSKFVLWYRVKQAIRLLLSSTSLSVTEIALTTGFYDSANFNKVMYELIGVKPSLLRKNSNLIQFWDLNQL